jgi:hypothetical protein
MTSKGKQLPHEKRKGEAALSDFAEYVEKQQELRFPSHHKTAAAGATAAAPASKQQQQKQDDGTNHEHHDELDLLLDTLDLSDALPRRKLRDLLLSATDNDADASLRALTDVVAERLAEGVGETVFEIGYEESGEGMRLTREEWDVAYKRLAEAAKGARADCQLLLTKGVGGDAEGTTAAGKTEGCSGKVLVRQTPRTVEDVIETRIAVVGNGKALSPFHPIKQGFYGNVLTTSGDPNSRRG